MSEKKLINEYQSYVRSERNRLYVLEKKTTKVLSKWRKYYAVIQSATPYQITEFIEKISDDFDRAVNEFEYHYAELNKVSQEIIEVNNYDDNCLHYRATEIEVKRIIERMYWLQRAASSISIAANKYKTKVNHHLGDRKKWEPEATLLYEALKSNVLLSKKVSEKTCKGFYEYNEMFMYSVEYLLENSEKHMLWSYDTKPSIVQLDDKLLVITNSAMDASGKFIDYPFSHVDS